MSKAGLTAVRDSTDEIKTLRQFAQDAPAVGKPLRQFLQVADNRDRSSHWPDIRATESAPPPPDPTADTKNKSFTGMESFWNYLFWQGLALNEFDTASHYLRTTVYVGTECAPYTADARPKANGGTQKSQDLNKNCNSYLGPYEPGVNACDVTDKDNIDNGCPGGKSTTNGSSPIPSPKSSGSLPKFNSLDPKAGQPAATTPLPGQIDPSKPHVVLPPQLQELINQLAGKVPQTQAPSLLAGQAPQPPSGARSPDQLLNFLLAP
jgi:hypothetical protein